MTNIRKNTADPTDMKKIMKEYDSIRINSIT